jgi:hypothetical protein
MNKKERKNTMTKQQKIQRRIIGELEPVDIEQAYRDFLDECEPEVKVAGLFFCASRVIEELDPIAFRCGVSDHADGLINCTITDEINGNYYDLREVESIIEEVESEGGELQNA